MEENSQYPNLYQCIILIIIYYGMQFIAGMLLNSISPLFLKPSGYTMLSNIAVIITSSLTIYYATSKDKNILKPLLRHPDYANSLGFYAIIMAVGIELVMYAMYYAAFPQAADTIITFNDTGAIITLPFKILLFPVFEEVIFRGIILNGLSKNYNISKAIVISALIFGILHFNLIQSTIAFISALVLGYIYISTRSIWICIIAHVIKNILAVNNYVHYHLIHNLNFNFNTYIILGVLLTSTGFYMLSKAQKHNNQVEV